MRVRQRVVEGMGVAGFPIGVVATGSGLGVGGTNGAMGGSTTDSSTSSTACSTHSLGDVFDNLVDEATRDSRVSSSTFVAMHGVCLVLVCMLFLTPASLGSMKCAATWGGSHGLAKAITVAVLIAGASWPNCFFVLQTLAYCVWLYRFPANLLRRLSLLPMDLTDPHTFFMWWRLRTFITRCFIPLHSSVASFGLGVVVLTCLGLWVFSVADVLWFGVGNLLATPVVWVTVWTILMSAFVVFVLGYASGLWEKQLAHQGVVRKIILQVRRAGLLTEDTPGSGACTSSLRSPGGPGAEAGTTMDCCVGVGAGAGAGDSALPRSAPPPPTVGATQHGAAPAVVAVGGATEQQCVCGPACQCCSGRGDEAGRARMDREAFIACLKEVVEAIPKDDIAPRVLGISIKPALFYAAITYVGTGLLSVAITGALTEVKRDS